jgi:hypothetical protein
MPKFFASEDTETLDLGDGFWVELKKELDYGEESELEGAAIKAGLAPDGTPKMEFSLKAMRGQLLALYVTDWNLPGADGKPVALPDNFERRQEILSHLDMRTAKLIAERIERIRQAAGVAETVSLVGVDGAEENPTGRGADFAPAMPSRSGAGGAASPTSTFNGPLIGSFARP